MANAKKPTPPSKKSASQAAPLGVANWFNADWFTDVSDFNNELARFVTQRLQEDIQAQQTFMQCRSLGELQGARTKFFKTAVNQYTAEAGKMIEMGSAMLERARDGETTLPATRKHSTPV